MRRPTTARADTDHVPFDERSDHGPVDNPKIPPGEPVTPGLSPPSRSAERPYSYGSRDVQPGYESEGNSPPAEPWGKDPWSDAD